MNDAATLGAFLERVNRVVHLGPRDHLAVERLARSAESWNSEELRAALASVLARSPEQWREIAAIFDEMAQEQGSGRPRRRRSAKEGREQRARLVRDGGARRLGRSFVAWRTGVVDRLRNAPRELWAGFVGFVAVVAVSFALVSLLPAPPESGAKSDGTGAVSPTQPEVAPIDQPGFVLIPSDIDKDLDSTVKLRPPSLEPQILLGLAILSTFTFLFGLSWIRLPETYRAQREAALEAQEKSADAKRHELQRAKAEEGRALGLRYKVDCFLPISRQALLDSAERLGRIFGESPGSDLDAEATLDRTLAAAGRFEPVLESRLRRHDVVVLIDTEEGNHPWLDAFLRLLEAWKAQGITLREFTFSMAPDTVIDRDTKQPLKLEDLARQTEDLPLLIFSRQLDPLAFRGAAKWLSALEAWPRRAWLDPDPRAPGDLGRYRRRSIWELERHGLVRFYPGGGGIVQLARHLAGDGEGRSVDRGQPLAAVEHTGEMGEALRLWALVAALVPDPTWDQLEAVRRHFPEIRGVLREPQALQHLLDWVEGRTGQSAELSGGRGLAIPERWQDDWLRAQRRLEKAEPGRAGFEDRARRLLLEQLGVEAPEDPMDREVWRFKRAMHEAMLEPHRAAEFLKLIGDSPIRHEAIRWLKAELARREDGDGEPLRVGERDLLCELVGRSEGISLRALTTMQVLGWRLSLAGMVVASLLAIGVLLACGLVDEMLDPVASGLDKREDVTIEWPAIYEVTERMIFLPGGTFEMGGDYYADEQPIHSVEVASFMISKAEVTVEQYRTCVANGACAAPAIGSICNWNIAGREYHPINCVSWFEAKRYAEWMGGRLPTEAEWEYAARSGGLDRDYPWGDAEPTCDVAVMFGCGSGTQPVCSSTAGNTELGLCDMAGNVWEWIEDDWHDDYHGAPADGSAWVYNPRASGRVIRGGSRADTPRNLRVAYRDRLDPQVVNVGLGFRIVKPLPSSRNIGERIGNVNPR